MAPGYFTAVAATGVLGTQNILIHQNVWVAQLLWWLCLILWGLCTYTIFTLLTIRSDKPSLADGINGGWLIAVVATQSVCVLGCSLGVSLMNNTNAWLFIMLSFWLGGGMLYFWIIALIFYRYMFFQFSPGDLMPPYWINMGAVAISTLAGALLARIASPQNILGPFKPFIVGLTVMFWATATWWIPMLVVLGIWRHVSKRFPISYDPLYWGLVFPLGMYAVCSLRLAQVIDVSFLAAIAKIFLSIGAIAWLLAFLGMAKWLIFAILLTIRQLQTVRRTI